MSLDFYQSTIGELYHASLTCQDMRLPLLIPLSGDVEPMLSALNQIKTSQSHHVKISGFDLERCSLFESYQCLQGSLLIYNANMFKNPPTVSSFNLRLFPNPTILNLIVLGVWNHIQSLHENPEEAQISPLGVHLKTLKSPMDFVRSRFFDGFVDFLYNSDVTKNTREVHSRFEELETLWNNEHLHKTLIEVDAETKSKPRL